MRPVATLAVIALAVSACGSNTSTTGTTASTDTQATEEAPAEPTATATPVTDVAIVSGGVGVGQVEVNATTIDYVTIVPEGFELGDTAPVLLAMPPGGQDLGLTQTIAEGTYQSEAVARGWVVVSPAAPNGELYFQGSEALIDGFVEWIRGWVELEGGLPHLSGISNGGISAFRVLAENPTGFHSLIVFPGFPRSDSDKAALEELVDVPIRMFVGETDESWATAMEAAFRALDGNGVDVTFEAVEGEGHFIRSMGDGVRVFDELDAIRESAG